MKCGKNYGCLTTEDKFYPQSMRSNTADKLENIWTICSKKTIQTIISLSLHLLSLYLVSNTGVTRYSPFLLAITHKSN